MPYCSFRHRVAALILCLLICSSAVEIKDEDSSAVLVPQDAPYREQNLVLACLLDGSVVALDADNGDSRWRIEGTQNFFTPLDKLQEILTSKFNSSMSTTPNQNETSDSTELRTLFFPNIADIVNNSPFFAPDGTVFIGGKETQIFAIDSLTGRISGGVSTGGVLGGGGLSRGTLLVGRTIYTVRAVSSDDTHWNVSVGDFHVRLLGVLSTEPAIGLNNEPPARELVVALDNSVLCLDSQGELLWSFASPAPVLTFYRVLLGAPGRSYILRETPHFVSSGSEDGFLTNPIVRLLPGSPPQQPTSPRPTMLLSDKPFTPNDSVVVIPPQLPPPTSSSFYLWIIAALSILLIFSIAGGVAIYLRKGGRRRGGRANVSGEKQATNNKARVVSSPQLDTPSPPTPILSPATPDKRKKNKSEPIASSNPASPRANASTAVTAVPIPAEAPKPAAPASTTPTEVSIVPAPSPAKTAATTVAENGILKIGKIEVYTTDILGYGSNGTVVYGGKLDGRKVAVKRMLLTYFEVAAKEVAVFLETDEHPNVVRYYAKEQDGEFIYLALSFCPLTLEEYVTKHKYAYLEALRCMQQLAAGLLHLHSLNILHRDLKPANVLLDTKNNIRITDMSLARKIEKAEVSFNGSLQGHGSGGSLGWRAPEVVEASNLAPKKDALSPAPARKLSKKSDIFVLGCLFYYVLTKGGHPFGAPIERETRILENKRTLQGLESMPEAAELIISMLNPDPAQRPTAEDVLLHPLFWSASKRLLFLKDASDRLEIEKPTEPIVLAIEARAPLILGSDWSAKIHPLLIDNIGKYRKYNYATVRDLLRVIRNKSHHFRDLPPDVQAILGAPPDAFLAYFSSKFPLLLIEVWRLISHFSKKEPTFSQYFTLTTTHHLH